MLTSATVEYLRERSYAPSAERRNCILPLGAIYWSDEIPDFAALAKLRNGVSSQVFRLMGIRLQIWGDQTLSVEDQAFWNAAIALVPDCPIFQRLIISVEDREVQLAAERSASGFIDAMAGAADDFEIDQEGNWSATFDLEKVDRKPAWKRLFAWWPSKRS